MKHLLVKKEKYNLFPHDAWQKGGTVKQVKKNSGGLFQMGFYIKRNYHWMRMSWSSLIYENWSFYPYWHLCTPTDTFSPLLTPVCPYWYSFAPTDACLPLLTPVYPYRRLLPHWHVLVPTDTYLPRGCPCWHVITLSDAYLFAHLSRN